MFLSSLIQKTVAFVKPKLLHDAGGQDWLHTERVWKMAQHLQAQEGGDRETIELAALLHDVGNYKHYDLNEAKGLLVLQGIMDALGIDSTKQGELLKIIDSARFRGEATLVATSLEGKIIQDADWLDSLGAIGIARNFAYGGKIGRVLHDPKRQVKQDFNHEAYVLKKHEGTSINFFFEKILKLPRMINTKTAKKIAEHRIKFIEIFLEEFNMENEIKI